MCVCTLSAPPAPPVSFRRRYEGRGILAVPPTTNMSFFQLSPLSMEQCHESFRMIKLPFFTVFHCSLSRRAHLHEAMILSFGIQNLTALPPLLFNVYVQ